MVYYQIFLLLSIWSIFVLCQDNNDINNSIKLHQLNEKQTAAHSSTTTPYTTNPTISPSYHKNHNHHHHQLQDGFLSCSNETAALIVNRFIASKRDGSSCPAEKWLPLMMKTDPYSDKVFMNVGFNKGYNFAIWLNIFAPWMNVTATKWRDELCPLKHTVHCCGVCDDCEIEFPSMNLSYPKHPYTLTMIGAELNSISVESIPKVFDQVIATADPFNKTRSLSMMTHTRVFTFHGAISDHNGNITVANCNFGIETCTIVPASDRKAKTVPALTIDSLTKDFLATHDTYMHHHHSIKLNALKANSTSSRQGRRKHYLIDILMIDAEGYDAKALKGCRELFEKHYVRVLIFEYHKIYPWNEFALANVLTSLQAYDFDCYFQGQGRLWKITGNCWHEKYEFHEWSNVMCFQRNDIWHKAVQDLVVRRMPDNKILARVELKHNTKSLS
eukprot:gene2374-2606_t